jgi:myo-inositol-1(or 4)-monophosphatase
MDARKYKPRRKPPGPDRSLQHRINAGRVALKAQIPLFKAQFGQVESDWKHDGTRVTFVDYAVTERLFHALRADFPNDDFCSEEANPEDEEQVLDARYAWVLDPVDGTNNYALGVPLCAISLALLCDGFPVYGMVYDFSRDTLIQGGPGFGLYDGCRKIAMSEDQLDQHALFALHFPLSSEDILALTPLLNRYRIRSFGSSALNLAYAAIGLVHGVVDTRLYLWDMAAGWALLKAAGFPMHFGGPGPFPLRHFHAKNEPMACIAGTPAACAQLGKLLPRMSAVKNAIPS